MPQPLRVALATDENYLDGLMGTLAGVARSSRATKIDVHILDCGISNTSWHELSSTVNTGLPSLVMHRVPINREQLNKFAPAYRSRGLNNATYARFLLPELLPDVGRILYLDCDLLIDTDLLSLFNTSLDGALVAAVMDSHVSRLDQNITQDLLSVSDKSLPAFNAGVMLLDLEAQRQNDLLKPILELIPQIQSRLQSQAVLNYLYCKQWKALDPRWNRQKFVTANFTIHRTFPHSIWHFIGKMKPWHFAAGQHRGLMLHFYRDMLSTGWIPRAIGTSHTHSPVWRDTLKLAHAIGMRNLRRASSFFSS